ncbi:MAG: carbamoyltransferase [Elusimicrobia bacterium]|nr:carbamoyltransferase [Elusimicrobiota bacterium]
MRILGISAFYHDSAACIVQDGVVLGAAQEERFSRRKHDAAFPSGAAAWCLARAGIPASGLDAVAFYDKPLLKFERILETALSFAPRGFRSFQAAMPVWAKEKLWTREVLRRELAGYDGPIRFLEHHESHAASAFFPSPFQEAAVLTMDGVGEWATSSIGRGAGNRLEVLKELHFPHSLGLLYSAFTYYAGFKVNSGEYKVMGLAPYGQPRYKDLILRELVDLRPDGSLKLNMDYFGYGAGLTMTNERFHSLFGGPPRRPESELTQRVKDLAASVQAVCEEAMLKMAREALRVAGSRNLCLAGGVALNCVGNGRILREAGVDGLWVQPAAGDAGGALGAALFVWHQLQGNPRRAAGRADSRRGAFLGPEYSDAEVEACLAEAGAVYAKASPEEVAGKLAAGAVVGWFQGALEFGPRALGGRSILGDPRASDMQRRMNLKIKGRESFRPFAPAVLRERAGDYFELGCASPYMLVTARVKEGGGLPAVTHVDGSARVQTVARADNAPFYELLQAFQRKTGCPVLVNTSFNVRGEPIVMSPRQAYACFMRTEMDYLAIGGFLLDKRLQPAVLRDDSWKKEFVLD